jgi:hypothetical protein
MRFRRRLPLAVGLVAVCAALAVAAGAVARGGASAAAATPSAECHLGNGIKHVIEITFDNTHYFRDNPNVLSDLEQMPALKNFFESKGTMLTNNHTPLIAHTADDSLTNYSGLYGDRHGQGIGNSYETYVGGIPVSKSSFAYWTGTYGLDTFPNMPYSGHVPAAGAPPSTPPAPWAPYTRAGCNFGAVSTANMVLENTNPDLQNFFGAGSPEVAQYNADPNSFKNNETADYLGLGVHCAKGETFCASAQAVKFNETTPSNTATTDSLPDEPGGYVGFQALFGHRYLTGPLSKAANNPDGTRTVNGHTYPVVNAAGNLTDLNGNQMNGAFTSPLRPGFPGFGPISAAQTLAYVADMQETGVPVTYGYISDAHERKPGQTGCSNSGTTQGPGDRCYKANLAAYNAAFDTFFTRLADDGIDASNTLFVLTADEGDHFAGANVGRTLEPVCTGTPETIGYTCSYPAGQIGERQVAIHGLLQNQLGNSTPFYNEPQGNSIYINGNPGPKEPVTRQLERDFANAKANDPYDGDPAQLIASYMADPATEALLHFVNADPNRTPSFTVFPKGDYFMSFGQSDSPPCPAGTTADTAAANCTTLNNGFSWDHGYYAPEIDDTYVGFVGPGVAHKGIDGFGPAQGPNSADGANATPKLDTEIHNPGTWADHTDIRPTMLALVGLKDDYVTDGRVLVEDLTIRPGKTESTRFQPLAACYKQLNSSVGEFGTSVLVADTAALKTGSSTDDSTYQSFLTKLRLLGTARDQLATRIKNDLFDAEFGNKESSDAERELALCKSVVAAAGVLRRTAGH